MGAFSNACPDSFPTHPLVSEVWGTTVLGNSQKSVLPGNSQEPRVFFCFWKDRNSYGELRVLVVGLFTFGGQQKWKDTLSVPGATTHCALTCARCPIVGPTKTNREARGKVRT